MSMCTGQDRESVGLLLVKQYLESADGEERKNILEDIDGLRVSFDEIKEWVRTSSSCMPQQSGIHRELVSIGGKKGEYFVSIPSHYMPNRPWPAVLTLHGVGGSGYGQIMAWLKSSVHKDDFIFVAPTYGPGLWWNEEGERIVLSVIDKVKRDYNIDANRVYLTGFSSGGHGVWYFALRYPSLFAAINPIAGECPLPSLLGNLVHVPVYIIHGARDSVIPVEAARDVSSRLEKLSNNVMYQELPALRHQFPVDEIGKVLDWFLLNKRTPYPKKVKFSTESTRYSASYWTEITEFSGLVGQVSGVRRDALGHLEKLAGFSEMATIEADKRDENNEIYLTTHEVKSLRLYLADELVDREKPLNVFINGKLVYSGKTERDVRTMLDTVRKRNDREALFSACLDLKVPSE